MIEMWMDMRGSRNGVAPVTALLLAASVACGGPWDDAPRDERADGEEPTELGQSQLALGEASCATGDPTASFVDVIHFTSATTYSEPGCFKAVKVDVVDFTSIGGDLRTRVFWNGSLPNDQVACERLWLGTNLYEDSGSGFEKLDFRSANGTWNGITCRGPLVEWFVGEMVAGGTYRITASARTAQTGGAATRSLAIHTETIPH